MKPAEIFHSTVTWTGIMAGVTGLSVCWPMQVPSSSHLDIDPNSTLKPWAMQISPHVSHFHQFVAEEGIFVCVYLCIAEFGGQQRQAGSPNLVFVTKYQVDCWDNGVWQCRIKPFGGVFIPRLFLLPCLPPSLSSYVSLPSPLARFPFLVTLCYPRSDPCS